MPTIRLRVLTEEVILSDPQPHEVKTSLVLAIHWVPIAGREQVEGMDEGAMINQVWDIQPHLGTFGSLSPRILVCVTRYQPVYATSLALHITGSLFLSGPESVRNSRAVVSTITHTWWPKGGITPGDEGPWKRLLSGQAFSQEEIGWAWEEFGSLKSF
jgi:hypothetical protein